MIKAEGISDEGLLVPFKIHILAFISIISTTTSFLDKNCAQTVPKNITI